MTLLPVPAVASVPSAPTWTYCVALASNWQSEGHWLPWNTYFCLVLNPSQYYHRRCAVTMCHRHTLFNCEVLDSALCDTCWYCWKGTITLSIHSWACPGSCSTRSWTSQSSSLSLECQRSSSSHIFWRRKSKVNVRAGVMAYRINS